MTRNQKGQLDPYQLETRRLAVQLYTEGMDDRGPLAAWEIAEVLNVSRQRVDKLLDDMGVAKRPRGRVKGKSPRRLKRDDTADKPT